MEKRIRIFATGNVQRVGFRQKASEFADKLGIRGKALYLGQGLLIEAEGDEPALDSFISWSRTGPEGSRIESFTIIELPLLHYEGFKIVHGVISAESVSEQN
jgi:acylphosphatase